jgi:hypothetical protein
LTGLKRKMSHNSIDAVLFARREAGLEAKAEKMLGVSVWATEYMKKKKYIYIYNARRGIL